MDVHSVGIIGYGQFGRFVEMLVRERFPQVEIRIARRGESDAIASAAASDLVFLCVPISAYEVTARMIAPSVSEASIVVDVATVKSHTVQALRDAGIKRFIATHPMFGPYSYEKQGKSLNGLRIALTESTLTGDETGECIRFLEEHGLRVLRMSSDEHDQLIAETLFLTHLLGQTVHQGGFERTSIDTVSFGYLMDAVESVAQDEALFRDVYRFNRHCEAVLARVEAVQRNIAASLKKAMGPGLPQPSHFTD